MARDLRASSSPPTEEAATDPVTSTKQPAESDPPTAPAFAEDAPVDDESDGLQTASVHAGSGQISAVRSMPSAPLVGIPRSLRAWDRYEVLELIGSGGMGAVYKARDPRLNRMVALKIVHPMLGHAPGSTGQVMVKRFMREARLQASLEHPFICKVYEIGELPGTDEESGFPYIAMQLITGLPLHKSQLEMSHFEKVHVMQQVAEALHVAHRQGLIHRDIKPSNIMVERTDDGKFHPYVMDFGLAREAAASDQSRSGVIEGTPAYMSPEQARGENRNLDRRSDVYSLGVTLYELLAGRLPYTATGGLDLMMAVLTADPVPLRSIDPNIPIDLEAVTLKALEKEPPTRYDSAKLLAEDLGRYLDGEPVLARHIGVGQRLYRQARKHKPLVALGAALLASLIGLVTYGVRMRLLTLERERQAKQQAELAQKLGQEITKMEWLLRSARQLPLHSLEREKLIVRSRMSRLQTELSSYGDLARGLAHYALGRGHLALHEYPDALRQLQLAINAGNQSADVQYALGLVLGKHFEQAMYEARLSGGGDWAKKQLKEIEPKYLSPAIESLKNSRLSQSDAPGYLEALIAYYQRDYETALKEADSALKEAPWLYEASKLSGDIHLERALQARDSGQYDEADKEFAAAVKRYEEAAGVGRSDGEVYEGLAEAWVRQIEMATSRGQANEAAYAAAVAAGDKISIAEPQSIAGRLKKAYAAMMEAAAIIGSGTSSSERVQKCLTEAQAVLEVQPEHPYARDVAANCYSAAADLAQGRGENPEPYLRKALARLVPAVEHNPYFLWGLNDLTVVHASLGIYLQSHGSPSTRDILEKALQYADMAIALDGTYQAPQQNSLFIWARLLSAANSESDIQQMLARTDDLYAKCMKINPKNLQCNINYLLTYSRAAQRTYQGGRDPQARIARALEAQKSVRNLGGNFLDADQHTALAYLVDASERVRKKQEPGTALMQMQVALTRCFAQAKEDAMCRTIAAQADWVAADWEGVQGKPAGALLKQALLKAELATQSPEKSPDAWQALAETHLRLGRAEGVRPAARDEHVSAGLAALDKAFAINPNHASARATQGELELLRGKAQRELSARKAAGQAAVQAFELAARNDPLLNTLLAPRITEAKNFASAL